MKNNKKVIIGVALLITLIIICSFIKPKKEEYKQLTDPEEILAQAEKESKSITDKEKAEFRYIDVEKFVQDYESSEKNVILIASSTCNYCKIAEPILQNISYRYKISIEYLNIAELDEEGENKLKDSDEYFANGVGTPTLLIIGNNKIIDQVNGLVDKGHYVEFFKKNNFIKE